MRKVRQILRLKLQGELSDRAIARSVNVSRNTVNEYTERAVAAGLTDWEQVSTMTEAELEQLLFPPRSRAVREKNLGSSTFSVDLIYGSIKPTEN